jgi:hypothetical protein
MSFTDDLRAVESARRQAEQAGDTEAAQVLGRAYEMGSSGRQREVLTWWQQRQAETGTDEKNG